MKKGILFIFISVLLVSGIAMAKGSQESDLDLPENKWWQNPRVVKVLKLTEQEQSKLNDLFVNSQRQMFDLKTNVQKEKFEIEQLLEQKRWMMRPAWLVSKNSPQLKTLYARSASNSCLKFVKY